MKAVTCLLLLLAISATICQEDLQEEAALPEEDAALPPVADGECPTVVQTAVQAALNTLVAALTAGNLAGVVGRDFVGTVFAPTDDAFVALLATLDLSVVQLFANTELLTQVLLLHVVPDVVAFAADLEDGQELPTAAGVSLTVSIEDDAVFIVSPAGVRAQVVTPDVAACEAVVHVIDAVLLPILPTDALPPAAEGTDLEELPADEACTTVVDTAVNSELSTLVAALTAADLTDVVGPDFAGTVFAPTEEAFVALLTDLNLTAEELLADTELLTQVLLIHVIPDVAAFAADLTDGQEIPTAAEGVVVTVSLEGESVFIVAPSGVRAQVVIADVVACDAVVHVIDAVLTPAP